MSAAPAEVATMSPRRSHGDVSDAKLLRAVAAGDLASLGVLYDRHASDVRSFARRASHCREDADDLVHEVFLAVVKVAGSYDGRGDARPFLIGISAQLVRRRRSVARLAEVLSDFARSIVMHPPGTPEESASASEESRLFERALGRLSQEKRLVFLMIEGEGLVGEDVALALGIPVATVRTRLHHARKEVRAAMRRGSKP